MDKLFPSPCSACHQLQCRLQPSKVFLLSIPRAVSKPNARSGQMVALCSCSEMKSKVAAIEGLGVSSRLSYTGVLCQRYFLKVYDHMLSPQLTRTSHCFFAELMQ